MCQICVAPACHPSREAGIGRDIVSLPLSLSADEYATWYWQSGGAAWAYNDWLPTQSARINALIPMNSVRAGTTPDTTAYYQWMVTGVANAPTAEGIHPTSATHQLLAAEARTVWASLP